MAQTIGTTVGYWALGVVIFYMTASTGFRLAFTAGDYIHDLSTEVQTIFGRIIFVTFACALVYLMFWGCYLFGEYVFTAAASYL